MMKKILFAFLLFIGCLPTLGQSHREVDVKALEKAYQALEGNPSSLALQQAYLDQFPSTWSAFYATYRFSNRPGFNDAMYRAANAHMDMLDKLDGIARKTYYAKLIGISVGGFWAADAPNRLRLIIEKSLDKDTEAFFKVLSGNSAARQMLFWQFMWENPVKSAALTTRYNRLKQTMGAEYPKEVETMRVAYDYFFGELPMGAE